METLIIHYEKSNRAARKLIDAVIASGVIKVDKKKKTGLQLALDEANRGKTYSIQNPKNAVAEILGKDV
ncbi:MAG: hypothetical protein GZ091_02480 [Paludibacter sp.]|nr:hypothetical protein [Paludibacter sp.]